MIKTAEQKLKKTRYGFYQFEALPSKEELMEYYSEKYYQQATGSYELSYTEKEIDYFRLKAAMIYRHLERHVDMTKSKVFLDVGCGEGWLMNEFKQRGHSVLGVDFSRYAIEKFHPGLVNNFEQCNIYDFLERQIQRRSQYDIIMLANVIEHVQDPVDLLTNIKNIIADDGKLIIVAPNDFSKLHEYLLFHKVIDEPFWVSYPSHLSYFNKESMENVLMDKGFEVESVVADNPVDLNLLNKNSNYIKGRRKGKNIHFFRVEVDNLLAGIDADKLLAVYEIFGSMGVGRNLTYFCSKKRQK